MRAQGSFIEKIGMSPGAFEADFFSVELVDQYPVRFDVCISEGALLALKRMITVCSRQWQSFDQ